MAHDRAHRPFPSSGGGDPPTGPENDWGRGNGGTYFLGRYRVVDEIGIGGMASVHLARVDGPGGFQKWVAIKRIHPHLVEDETFVQMFFDEARVAARISHPNVATVFELGKHEDTYWIAMEYLHGEPLREVMRRTEELGQPMPPEIACRVIADAAEGLHAAHELLGKNGEKLGLVHRDVTPHNLFVTYDGTTKVVDFGIAKFSSRMASTRAGTLKGKLAYMSPEQVQGEAIDRRTDLFALGVVLWELTTGQRLFRMDSDLDTLAKVQECFVPRPSTVVRGYPIDLEKIVMKALAKQKNERYKTAREFSRALQSLLMRRGLFIAGDEVASYTQSIFQDRIRKRDAHLRWAAEVTQTINVDSKFETGGHSTWTGDASYNSDVQAHPSLSRAPAPRPAAGAPALPTPAIAAPPPGAPVPAGTPRQVETVRPPGPGRTAQAPVISTSSLDHAPTVSAGGDKPQMTQLPTVRGATPKVEPRAQEQEEQASEFLDDFDDTDDTIVSSSRPDFDDELPAFRGNSPVPAAGRPAPPAYSLAGPPRGPGHDPRTPLAMPNPAPQPVPHDERQSYSSQTEMGETVPVRAVVASVPPSFPDPAAASRAHGVMQHAATVPPVMALPRHEQHTVSTHMRRRIPVWAVAAAAAVLGILAFVLIVYFALRSSHQKADLKSEGAAASGPLAGAREAFHASIGELPAPPTARSPSDPSSHAPEPAPPATQKIETTNKPASAPSAGAPVAAQRNTGAPAAVAYGLLSVRCNPACDQVLDNGTSLGASPIYKQRVAVGPRRITLVWSDPKVTKVVSTIVVADQEAKVQESRP